MRSLLLYVWSLFFTVIMLGIDRFCAQLQSNKVSVYSKTGKCLQMQAIMTDEEFGSWSSTLISASDSIPKKKCKCNDFRNNISCPY